MRSSLTIWLGMMVLLAGCGKRGEAKMVPFLHGLQNRLVVVFEKDADPRDIFSFLEQHTNSPTPHPNKSHPMRPEIGGLVKKRIQGHDAYEIGFYPTCLRPWRLIK